MVSKSVSVLYAPKASSDLPIVADDIVVQLRMFLSLFTSRVLNWSLTHTLKG